MAIFKAEFSKYFYEVKCYYPDHLVNLLVTYMLFLGFFWGLSGSTTLYIGFIFWFFSSTVISEGSLSISYEKQTGTFEQLLLKPVNILLLLSIRTVVWFLFTFIKVAALLLTIGLTLNLTLPFDIRIIPVLLITLIGLYGFGMLLSASTLVFTKTASFDGVISYFFLFFTGGVIPLNQLPKGLTMVSELLPLTKGIQISQYYAQGIAVTAGDMAQLMLNSGIYFILGLIVFSKCYRYAQEKGLNGAY